MSDPLSIASAVVGLVTAAVKISSVLTGFVSRINDVPESARAALSAVESMRLTLSSFSDLEGMLSRVPRERKDMIHVWRMTIIFRESILSMSELEALVCPLKDGENISIWDNVKWLLAEEKILSAVDRLRVHNASLSTILNILQCQSDIEVRESLNTLQKSMQELVDKNDALMRRLENMDCHRVDESSIRFFDDAESLETIRRRPSYVASEIFSNNMKYMTQRDFEITLEQSRVYARVQSNDIDMFFTRSEAGTTSWSMLSLNTISVISVLKLPIVSFEEVNNIGTQLVFTGILSAVKEQGTLPNDGDTRVSVPISSPRKRSSTVTVRDNSNAPSLTAKSIESSARPGTIQEHPSAPKVADMCSESNHPTPPETPDGLRGELETKPMGPHSFPSFVRASYPFQPGHKYVHKDGLTIISSFRKGDIMLINKVDLNGWADGILLVSGARGWIPTNYVEAYEPEEITSLLNSLAILWTFVSGDVIISYLKVFGHTGQFTHGILAGVRDLLAKTNCLTREGAILQRSKGLKEKRRSLLKDLSSLVKTERQRQYEPYETRNIDPAGDILDRHVNEMMLGALKVANRGAEFLDALNVLDADDESKVTSTSPEDILQEVRRRIVHVNTIITKSTDIWKGVVNESYDGGRADE